MIGDIGVLDKEVVLTGYAWHEARVTGLHDLEHDEGGLFAWSEKCFHLMLHANYRYLYLKLGTDRECLLHVAWAENSEKLMLIHGWHLYALDLQNEDKKELGFTVEVDHSDIDDPRELGVMVRSIGYDNDSKRYSETVGLIENRKKILKSFKRARASLSQFR